MKKNIIKIALLGAGKLNRAFLRGLILSDSLALFEVMASVRSTASLESFKAEFPQIACTLDNKTLLQNAQWIFLGTKPHDVFTSLAALSEDIRPSQHLVSLCAGVSLENLENHWKEFKSPPPFIHRLMANTAMERGAGIFGHSSKHKLPRELEEVLNKMGKVFRISESQFDAFTTLSASAPAFILEALKGLESYAQNSGLEASQIPELLQEVLKGSASLITPNDSLESRIQQIATPKGMTAEGLRLIQEEEVAESFYSACQKTHAKCLELMKAQS
jgi:pyrroline-5-carboxylate reductase